MNNDRLCRRSFPHRCPATVCHPGAISLRTGQSLRWEPAGETFTGDHADEANTHPARELRAPCDFGFAR